MKSYLTQAQISGTRLITSYALPPQTSFTCPPCSVRTRVSKSTVERRTYVSTSGSQPQVTLFHETEVNSAIQTSSETHTIEGSEAKVVCLGTVTASRGSDVSTNSFDLLLVKENGEIQCLDGNNLKEKWTSPSSALRRDTGTAEDAQVEFVHFTDAFASSQTILKDRQDVFAIFPQEISEDGFNPVVLFIITKSLATSTRNIHIITLPRRLVTPLNGTTQSVDIIHTTSLAAAKGSSFTEAASFGIQISAGTLQQLSPNYLTTFDLTKTTPKEVSSIKSRGAKSFLRLSSTSSMIATDSSVSVYNPKYQALLAAINLDGTPALEVTKRKLKQLALTNGEVSHTCHLVSYYPKLNTAVAIVDNELMAIQIEGKSKASGLLIDSLGCPIREQSRSARNTDESKELWLSTMGPYLPGSIGAKEEPFKDQCKEMEEALFSENASRFDRLMAEKIGGDWEQLYTSGYKKSKGKGESKPEPKVYSADVDRRWIIFALKHIFSWAREDDGEYRLTVPFYPPYVFMWLMKTGSMTTENIESALRNEIRLSGVDRLPAGELVNAVVEIDPDMDLLLALVSRNFLGAAELLCAIRILMDSLELFGDKSPTKQQQLTHENDHEEQTKDIEAQIEELEAEAEEDLALAEYQLGPGSGVRGEALSMALSKLYSCPNETIVFALQMTFTSQEIVSLIYLLRFELARGAWTSRYLDGDQLDQVEEGAIADNSIILISSLLNNCIDSIGAGGWISGDARLINGDPFEAEELIASLKLEVSAALEGIEEATYLKGLISEMIRFGDASVFQQPDPQDTETPSTGEKRKRDAPIILPESTVSFLPLGLKVDKFVSTLRVGAGGEVVERSRRDIGRLKSRKIGKYTREKIII